MVSSGIHGNTQCHHFCLLLWQQALQAHHQERQEVELAFTWHHRLPGWWAPQHPDCSSAQKDQGLNPCFCRNLTEHLRPFLGTSYLLIFACSKTEQYVLSGLYWNPERQSFLVYGPQRHARRHCTNCLRYIGHHQQCGDVDNRHRLQQQQQVLQLKYSDNKMNNDKLIRMMYENYPTA